MRILELLAAVTAFAAQPIEELLLHESPRLPWGSTLLVVTAIAHEALLAALLDLQRAGRRVVLFTLAEKPPGGASARHHRLPPAAPGGRRHRTGVIRAGIVDRNRTICSGIDQTRQAIMFLGNRRIALLYLCLAAMEAAWMTPFWLIIYAAAPSARVAYGCLLAGLLAWTLTLELLSRAGVRSPAYDLARWR